MEATAATVSAADAAAGCEPVFALASAEQLTSLRVGALDTTPTYDAVLAALMAVEEGDEPMAAFMQANRDLLDYRFLYRVTSEFLRAENTGQQERARALDAARMRAVKAAQRFDTPLYKEVGDAESRLGGLLALQMQGKPPTSASCVQAAGSSPPAIFAFWLVLVAAICAWESKLDVASVAAQARTKIADLTEIRTALEADDELMVSGGVAPLHRLMATCDVFDVPTGLVRTDSEAASAQARALLDDVASEPRERTLVLRRVGCAYCQVQRHGFSAYNPAVQRLAALYDVLLHGAPQPLVAVDIQRPPREVSSDMVKMANEADSILREAGVEIPLFW